MDISKAKNILSEVQAGDMETLAQAHSRYMHFCGVWSQCGISDEQIKIDRAGHSDLLCFGEGGIPALSDVRCAEFMHRISGLPVDWCLAFDTNDFYAEHGDFEELLEKQERLRESEKLAALYE